LELQLPNRFKTGLPNEIPGLLSQLQAVMNGTAEPVVRRAWNDAVMIKRTPDIGVRSILIPFVQNAEEARWAVAAACYLPRGIRGVSVAPRYYGAAHEDMSVLIQVETVALKEIEEIAKVTFVAIGSDIRVLRRGSEAVHTESSAGRK